MTRCFGVAGESSDSVCRGFEGKKHKKKGIRLRRGACLQPRVLRRGKGSVYQEDNEFDEAERPNEGRPSNAMCSK